MKVFVPFNEKHEYIGDVGSVGLQTEQNVIADEKSPVYPLNSSQPVLRLRNATFP